VPSTTKAPSWRAPLRAHVVLATLAFAVLVVAGAKATASILAPAFLALVLTVAVHPVARIVRRHGWPKSLAGLLELVCAYAILLALIVSVVVAGTRLTTLLGEYTGELRDLSDSVASTLSRFGVGEAETATVAGSLDLSRVTDLLGNVLASAGSLLSDLALIVTLLLFFALDAQYFAGRLSSMRTDRAAMVGAMESFASGTRRYLVVSTIFGLIVAVVDTLFLALTPVPAPVLWGLLAFITNYIPNVGFILGLIPPALLGLLEGGPRLMLVIIVVYCGVNFVLQSVIQPRYVGDAVGLSASVTMVSMVFWTWVLGPLGAFLAVPLTLFVKALLIDADPQALWLRPLIASPDAAGGNGAGAEPVSLDAAAPSSHADRPAGDPAAAVDGSGRTGHEGP
jgi:AI-2 transport protein TqsA